MDLTKYPFYSYMVDFYFNKTGTYPNLETYAFEHVFKEFKENCRKKHRKPTVEAFLKFLGTCEEPEIVEGDLNFEEFKQELTSIIEKKSNFFDEGLNLMDYEGIKKFIQTCRKPNGIINIKKNESNNI